MRSVFPLAALGSGCLLALGIATAMPRSHHRHAPDVRPVVLPVQPVQPVHPAGTPHRGGGPGELESVQVFHVLLGAGCTRLTAVADAARDVVIEVLGPATEHLQQNSEEGPREEVPVCPLIPGLYEVRVHVHGGDREGTARLFTVAPDGSRREVTGP